MGEVNDLATKLRIFYKENRSFVIAWFAYICVLSIVYWLLPPSYESNWLYFFEYLFENKAFPYIDSRVGYPPLGFLSYMPLAVLSGGNLTFFTYSLRTVNAIALSISLLLMYIILKEKLGKRRAFLTMIAAFSLPSLMLLSRLSNDILALFTTLLALYFLTRKKSRIAGMMIGIAAMMKGIPALLLLPAVIWTKKMGEQYRLFSSAVITVFVISLPFLMADPFMYLSVYIHHGDRGPWETIWALVDGWFSHGGFIHPDFDQFIYQTQLRKIYTPRPNDHAFYAWRYTSLPVVLFILEIVSVTTSVYLFRRGGGKGLLKAVGAVFFGYIIFFKGYSPQFTVFMLPILLMSLKWPENVGLGILLDVSTELQVMAWNPWEFISRDLHRPLLVYAVLLRTIALALAFMMTNIRLYRIRERRER